MTTLIAHVSLDGVQLNGRMFNSPTNPGDYASALAAVPRVVEPPTPAPFGHKNNQIHLFDDLGLYLIEHHASRLIISICFVLWLEESPFKPAREYSGDLWLGTVRLRPGMGPRDLKLGTVPLTGPVLRLWSAERDEVWIGAEALGMKLRSGRRSRRLRIANLSVCFTSRNGYDNRDLQPSTESHETHKGITS